MSWQTATSRFRAFAENISNNTTISITGTPSGYRPLRDFEDTSSVNLRYMLFDGKRFEIGFGTWNPSAGTFTRANVVEGSQGFGTFVNFDIGQVQLAIEPEPILNRLPVNHIERLRVAIDSGDTDHDIDIGAGLCRDNLDEYDLVHSTSPFVKQIDAAWAQGHNVGGMADSGGVAADTWYQVLIMRNPDTGDIDFCFATDPNNRPSGWTHHRRIASVLTDASSNIVGFVQYGDWFFWKSPRLDIDASIGTAVETHIISIPTVDANSHLETGTACIALLNVYVNPQRDLYIRPGDAIDLDDLAPSTTAAPLATVINSATTAEREAHGLVHLPGVRGKIHLRQDAADTVRVVTVGYWDPRGRLP